jgi:hypothetical protein
VRLYHRFRNRLFRREWHFDDEDAAFAGHVADAYLAAVRPYRLPGDRKAQAEARPIAAAAVAKQLKQIALALRNAATLVFGLDEQLPPLRR